MQQKQKCSKKLLQITSSCFNRCSFFICNGHYSRLQCHVVL